MIEQNGCYAHSRTALVGTTMRLCPINAKIISVTCLFHIQRMSNSRGFISALMNLKNRILKMPHSSMCRNWWEQYHSCQNSNYTYDFGVALNVIYQVHTGKLRRFHFLVKV